jgi:MFS family permease
MLVAAAGNTAMQSLMPSIGRELGVNDFWVAAAFSLSAVMWVVAAPHWARRADMRGRRALMRVGLYGFISSMLICGSVVAAGLAGLLPPLIVFVIFMFGRGIYGVWGSASPPAVQAYVAARTEGEQRTNALSAIASSFGLGTIIGPAIAPLFIFQPLGLSGPLMVFALIGALVLTALVLRLPDDTPKQSARGSIVDYPSIGGMSSRAARLEDEAQESVRLHWRDPRILPWNIVGVGRGPWLCRGARRDRLPRHRRLGLAAEHSQQSIALVLMAGAVATLLGQWWLIPQLHLPPRSLVLWARGSQPQARFSSDFGRHLRSDDELRPRLSGIRSLPPRFHQRRFALARPRRTECRGRNGHLGQRNSVHSRTGLGCGALQHLDAASLHPYGSGDAGAGSLG